MKKLYFRCNGGHYFTNSRGCPFDGWWLTGLDEVLSHFADLQRTGGELTIESIKSINPSEEVINRTLIIDFGSDDVIFDGLVPEIYFYGGKMLPLHECDLNLM